MKLSNLFRWPRRLWLRIPFWIFVLVAGFFVGRSAIDLVRPWHPTPLEQVPFRDHAHRKTSGKVTVTASALGAEESYALFGVPLALTGIQPVWIEVKNDEEAPLWYMRAGTDNEWFSPYEAYYVNRFRAPRETNKQLERKFYALGFQNPVMPGATKSGFVYTRLDEGTKAVDIDLVGYGVVRSFSFQLSVPGFLSAARTDFRDDADDPNAKVLSTEQDLRAALESLPATVMNKAGTKQGDPLNLAIVGRPEDILPAFSRRGWRGTEMTHGASVLKTIRSALLGRIYLYSPVSPLYVFGRSQDLSGQKARGDVNLRNHLRLWVTPYRYQDKQVWIGQISRDIGVRVIWGIPPTTHKIDPDTDESRNGLTQDLAYSQALARFGFVKGVGEAPRDKPRENLTGDPYWTDGLRAVLFFEHRPTTLGDIEMLDWERPPGVPESGKLFGQSGAGEPARPETKP
jgi:hypothetical protein